MTRATMPSMSEMMDLNRATSYLDPSNGIMAGQTFQTFPQTFPAETVGNTQTGHTSILSRDDKGPLPLRRESMGRAQSGPGTYQIVSPNRLPPIG